MPVLRMIKTCTKIPVGGTQNQFLIKLLISLKAKQFSNDVTYKLYYLVLREGTGTALVMWMVF
jgi:hypothetical protein